MHIPPVYEGIHYPGGGVESHTALLKAARYLERHANGVQERDETSVVADLLRMVLHDVGVDSGEIIAAAFRGALGYLDPFHDLSEDSSLNEVQRYCLLGARMTRELEERFAALPYDDFLQTGYWRIVRDVVRLRDGHACRVCPSTDSLHVHHRTYDHRGAEYRHLGDLTVLCKGCHERFHERKGVVR